MHMILLLESFGEVTFRSSHVPRLLVWDRRTVGRSVTVSDWTLADGHFPVRPRDGGPAGVRSRWAVARWQVREALEH